MQPHMTGLEVYFGHPLILIFFLSSVCVCVCVCVRVYVSGWIVLSVFKEIGRTGSISPSGLFLFYFSQNNTLTLCLISVSFSPCVLCMFNPDCGCDLSPSGYSLLLLP